MPLHVAYSSENNSQERVWGMLKLLRSLGEWLFYEIKVGKLLSSEVESRRMEKVIWGIKKFINL